MTKNKEEIMESIFSSGVIDCNWESDEIGTIHQIQSELEFIEVAPKIISEILSDYGYEYPVMV